MMNSLISGTNSPTAEISWSQYLSLRKSQRRYAVLFSIPTTAIGGILGANYFANIEAEPTDLIMGIEPVYAYGIATLACVGLGWLAGPTVGNTVWKVSHRRALAGMEKKDRLFHEHIVRNRADPSRQSVSNPVPDYYCEKVGNFKEYRQWLRDQAAYKRKATFGEAE
ncbi:mitochondrial import protein Pam17 [Pseudohyphozyma bogoriensis]|nr:mitochondrial import protein Pam17 [Pseudohyphozyma bogoriensis]